MGRIPLERSYFQQELNPQHGGWGQIQASLKTLERAFGNLIFGLLLVFQSTSGIGLAQRSHRKRSTWIVKLQLRLFRFRDFMEDLRCGFSGYKGSL
jgi:hypothetical protein